jgi:hypothetical protein
MGSSDSNCRDPRGFVGVEATALPAGRAATAGPIEVLDAHLWHFAQRPPQQGYVDGIAIRCVWLSI